MFLSQTPTARCKVINLSEMFFMSRMLEKALLALFLSPELWKSGILTLSHSPFASFLPEALKKNKKKLQLLVTCQEREGRRNQGTLEASCTIIKKKACPFSLQFINWIFKQRFAKGLRGWVFLAPHECSVYLLRELSSLCFHPSFIPIKQNGDLW